MKYYEKEPPMEADSPETIELEVYGEPKRGAVRFVRGGVPAGAVVIEDISMNQDEIIARVLARKHNKLSHSLRGGQ
jgi:hypothetical protein